MCQFSIFSVNETLLQWFEIKFIVENIVVDSAHLFVSTIGGNKSDDFWAIDKVRLCQKTEFRVIRTDREFKCQLVEDNTLVSSAMSEPKIGKFKTIVSTLLH